LNDIAGGFRLTIGRPSFHQFTALLQSVAAAVGLFSLVANDVGEGYLGISRGKLETLPAQSWKLERSGTRGGWYFAQGFHRHR